MLKCAMYVHIAPPI